MPCFGPSIDTGFDVPAPVASDDVELYVRPGGSDAAAGTLAAPLATFAEACARVPATLRRGARVTIDITGIDETIPVEFGLPVVTSSDPLVLDLGETAPELAYRAPLTIRATPAEVETLGAYTRAVDPTHLMVVLTMTVNPGWTPGEHVGRLLLGSGLGEWARIVANTADTLTIAGSVLGWTAPVRIAEHGAELTIGDPGNLLGTAGLTIAAGCEVAIVGVKLSAPAATSPAVETRSAQSVHLVCCDIAGLVMQQGEPVFIEACYLHDKTFAQNGASTTVRQSFLSACPVNSHGAGADGLTAWYEVRAFGCGPLGHGGNFEGSGGFQYERLHVNAGTGHGVEYHGGARSRVVDALISNCASSAVLVVSPGTVRLDDVDGTGNARYGIEATQGATFQATAATTVTGTLGNIFLGATGAIAYAALPANDYAAGATSQGVRGFR